MLDHDVSICSWWNRYSVAEIEHELFQIWELMAGDVHRFVMESELIRYNIYYYRYYRAVGTVSGG